MIFFKLAHMVCNDIHAHSLTRLVKMSVLSNIFLCRHIPYIVKLLDWNRLLLYTPLLYRYSKKSSELNKYYMNIVLVYYLKLREEVCVRACVFETLFVLSE